MPTVPANPELAELRQQAKALLRAAMAGEPYALRRIDAGSGELTLAAARRAIAREHGFATWADLEEGVEARTLELARRVAAFYEACVSMRPGRAARMLAETAAIAGYNFATAVLLGDIDRVSAGLRGEPELATRRDPRTGWTALHAVCASRVHQFDPARTDDLAAVASALIEAGADPLAPSPRFTPLGCAIAATNSGNSNRPIVELLLSRGARPCDEDIYLAGFAHDRHELLPLLLAQVRDPDDLRHAFAAPLDNDDAEGMRLLLAAGADPRRYLDDDGQEVPVIWAAVTKGCSAELLDRLLAHGADPNRPGPDGRSPYRHATAIGRVDLLGLLRRHHVFVDDVTDAERFCGACMRADGAQARALLAADPGLLAGLPREDRAVLVRAAATEHTDAVGLILDLGLPLDVRGDRGETALHAAAYAGSAGVVSLLLARGADLEARDTTWNDTPLSWAEVGSGERPTTTSDPDWLEVVRTLLQHGASRDHTTIDLDGPKPPSPEVAELLRERLRP